MFGRTQNKPVIETAAISAPAPMPSRKPEIAVLKESRAAIQAEIDGLQGQLDEADKERRKLHEQRAQMGRAAGNSYGGVAEKIHPETKFGRALSEVTDRCSNLCAAIDEKATEVERLTKSIHAIEREVPGRLRREALEAALPLVFELVDALCVAAAHEAEYVSLGGHVEQSVPWEFALAGGEGVELETILSRWLQALKREGIEMPCDISDNSRHLPAPAGVHARIQTDIGYASHAARCGMRGGVDVGFRQGYIRRARTF